MTKFKKDLFINGFDYLISFFLILISSKLIIENLGELNYGLYSSIGIIIAATMLVESGISLSVNHYGIKYIHNNQLKDFQKLIGSSINLYLLLSIFVFGTFYIYYHEITIFLVGNDLEKDAVKNLIILVPFIIFSSLMVNPFSSFLIATESWKESSIINILTKIFNIIMLFFIIDTSFEALYKILLLMIFINLIKILLLYSLMKRGNLSLKYNFDLKYLKDIVLYTRYSSIQFFAALSIFYLDKYFIKLNFSLVEIGYFNFAFLVGNYIHSFYGNIYRTLFPKFVSSENKELLFKKSLFIFFVASLVITLAVYILWIPFIGFAITQDFALKTYEYIFFVLILVNIRTIEIAMHYFYHGIGKPKIMGISSLVMAVLLITIYQTFINNFGHTGTLIAQIFVFSLVYLVLIIYTLTNFKRQKVLNAN